MTSQYLMSLAVAIVGIGSVVDAPHPAESTAALSTHIVFAQTTTTTSIDAFGPGQSCVTCMWHQRCDPGTHTAEATAAGTYSNAHEECIDNPPEGSWCAGHPTCSTTSASADYRGLAQLAFSALDGDMSALKKILLQFPGSIRLNQNLGSYEILTCDGDGVFAMIPITERNGSQFGE